MKPRNLRLEIETVSIGSGTDERASEMHPIHLLESLLRQAARQ
jgi:hypothetical protein